MNKSLREKFPYSGLFWSAFSPVRTEYGEMPCISSHLVQMQENKDQNNSEYRHFLRSAFPLNNFFGEKFHLLILITV